MAAATTSTAASTAVLAPKFPIVRSTTNCSVLPCLPTRLSSPAALSSSLKLVSGLSFLSLCEAFEMNILTTTNTLSLQWVSFPSSKPHFHRPVLANGNPCNGKLPTKSSSKEDSSANVKFLASVGVLTAMNLLGPDVGHAMDSEIVLNATPSLYDLSNGSIGDWFGGFLYSAGQQANEAVQDQLSALSFTSLAVIFGAGLVTSLSPCTLSVLPLTLGYIGAFGSGKSKTGAIGNSIAFALGLATTLALLGVGASFAGKAYGQIGQGLPLAASCLSIVMGLNLLEIIEIQLPSFFSNFDPRAAAANFPSSVQAYLAGLTFALAASPCSTPVLATLLAYVASSRDPIVGGSLLLTYTTGYVAPLLLAASFAGALQSLLSFRKFSAWINPMSGALLFGGGVYTMLDRLFPLTTMSMSM